MLSQLKILLFTSNLQYFHACSIAACLSWLRNADNWHLKLSVLREKSVSNSHRPRQKKKWSEHLIKARSSARATKSGKDEYLSLESQVNFRSQEQKKSWEKGFLADDEADIIGAENTTKTISFSVGLVHESKQF